MRNVIYWSFGVGMLILQSALFSQNFWEQTNGPWGPGNVFSIVINSSGDIFGGTEFDDFIYRSSNNGESWTRLQNGLTHEDIRCLAINSIDNIFAATFGGGIFRSTDNGNNWEQKNDGLSELYVLTVAINANDNIFAGTNCQGVFRSTNNGDEWFPVNTGINNACIPSLTITPNGNLFVCSNSEIYRSNDNGISWTTLNTGITEYIDLLVTNDSGHIFAGTGGQGVFRSTDNGNSWTPINNNLGNVWIRSLFINNNEHIFVTTGSDDLFRSINNGDSWQLISQLNARSFAAHPNGNIFSGSGAVYRSEDDGMNWEYKGLGSGSDFIMEIDFGSNQWMVAATGRGVQRSADYGASWLATPLVHDLMAMIINSSGHIFAGSEVSGSFRSTDNGETWQLLSLPISATAFATNSTDHIFAGDYSNGVFRSTDGGDTWVQVNQGLTNTDILCLAADASDNIYAGTYGSGLFRSTDNGANWAPTGLTNIYAWCTGISTNGNIFVSAGNSIYRSSDNGNTWTQLANNLSDIIDISINNNGDIYAASFGGGVYFSSDDGDNWVPLSSGLTTMEVRSLGIDESGYIYAGTAEEGVFRSSVSTSLPGTSSEGIQVSFSLLQNYPNPFNPSTTIRYNIPQTSKVVLKIYNTLGQEIIALVNENQTAGEKTAVWDGRDTFGNLVSSGVYIYRLEAGKFEESKKLVLLK